MTVADSYRVERRHGCRLIFGSVPLREMSALLSSSTDGEVLDLHLASLTGAAMVIGKPDALALLRASDDLPVCPRRLSDVRAAEDRGLPERFRQWLLAGERGNSSDFIASTVTGVPAGAALCVPYDGGDFGRCLGVIEALTEVSSEADILVTLSGVSDQWVRLAKGWKRLKEMHDQKEECLHTRIRSLLDGEAGDA